MRKIEGYCGEDRRVLRKVEGSVRKIEGALRKVEG